MNVDEIIKLMQAVSENGLTSLELKEGELKLSLKREKEMPQIVTVSAPSADAVSMPVHDVSCYDAPGRGEPSGSPGHGFRR